ncbi:hypothetical protein RE432_11285 [Pusillimonas sp. SM2304]|uniref:COG4315 family predicted lipoprotein n=1 Tax=Pusillimonas sp. SM2304 TaxID=3073241 RepID=UPI002874D861|nr:hypothetical protein [Pusillimonas sp. SM2304]MDS1141018.1 hypothetical protein [Pusillimonas sp. SM2304]
MKRLLCIAALAFAVNGLAAAADAPAQKNGDILVNAAGMTLYTFDKDTANSGKSACNDACAKAWPPLTAEAGAAATGKFSVIHRDDGTQQWAYDGKPLYLYRSDQAPGDRNGDNFREVWHVVKD